MSADEKTMELGCQWNFAESVGGSEIGPTTDSKGVIFTEGISSMIREALQNSMDARLDPNQPVKVVFSFKSMPAGNYKKFFGLKDHIKGVFDKYAGDAATEEMKEIVDDTYQPMIDWLESAEKDNKIHYLKISDYNTKGMDYTAPNEAEVEGGRFYAFARSVGYSHKENKTAGGRRGIGKAAIFKMSPINTIFISSLHEKGQHLFEGVCTLCTHKYDGKICRETGYYDNNGGYPVTDPEKIPNRFKRDEVGTDFYIMGH